MTYLHVNQPDSPIAKKLQAGEKPMDVTLQVRLGSTLGKQIRVSVGESVKVGRSPQSDIAFPHDAWMSRTHFSLHWDGGACWIKDLNSHHGTFVNGKRVQKTLLRDGDTVWAGVTVLAVRLQAHDSAAPVAA